MKFAYAVSFLIGTTVAHGSDTTFHLDQRRQSITFQRIEEARGGHQLRVKGPDGFYVILDFNAEEEPSFIPLDYQGSIQDGTYVWELNGVVWPLDRARTKEEEGGGDVKSSGKVASRNASSGAFTIQNGSFVDTSITDTAKNFVHGGAPDKEFTGEVTRGAPPEKSVEGNIRRRLDQSILDDLIVDGSACIGQDCVNGESFGFDTIRLKENNLRIKFQDTSNSASFPTNDWQITANDSANGGQNKFSIDDIDGGRTPFTLEAGAPSHSLYVDDGGRVGFGTSTPVTELHRKDGDTPTLRLEQDGTSGFSPQIFDIAENETNFFIRDVTNGSKLIFRIRPKAPTSSIDIAADGKVGMGEDSPKARLHLKNSDIGMDKPFLRIESTGASLKWDLAVDTDSSLVIKDAEANTAPFKIEPSAPGDSLVIGANGVTINGPNDSLVIGANGVTINGQAVPVQTGTVPAMLSGEVIVNSSGNDETYTIVFPATSPFTDNTYIVTATLETGANSRDRVFCHVQDKTLTGFTVYLRGGRNNIDLSEVESIQWIAMEKLT